MRSIANGSSCEGNDGRVQRNYTAMFPFSLSHWEILQMKAKRTSESRNRMCRSMLEGCLSRVATGAVWYGEVARRTDYLNAKRECRLSTVAHASEAMIRPHSRREASCHDGVCENGESCTLLADIISRRMRTRNGKEVASETRHNSRSATSTWTSSTVAGITRTISTRTHAGARTHHQHPA